MEKLALEELRDRIERLPVFELLFGGHPLDGMPQAVVRYKVLAVIDEFIKAANSMKESA